MPQYTTIATDQNNDIYMDGLNGLALKEDAEALANIVLNRAQTVTGELQYDLAAGIPYFTTIFASPPDVQMWQAFVKTDVLSVPGILSVDSLTLKNENGTLGFVLVATTVFGGITVNG